MCSGGIAAVSLLALGVAVDACVIMRLFCIFKICCGMQHSKNKVTPNLKLKSPHQGIDKWKMEKGKMDKNVPRQEHHLATTINRFPVVRMVKQRKSIKRNSELKQLRFEKVISGIKGVEKKKLDELKIGIKLQLISLMKFLCAFIVYACLGGLVFFYIEECSGLSNAGDNSIPAIGNTLTKAEFKDVSASCLQLYNEALGLALNDSAASNSSSFLAFKAACTQVLYNSTKDFETTGHSTNCVWDEFMLLKYAEYTIFTLLTIGSYNFYIFHMYVRKKSR